MKTNPFTFVRFEPLPVVAWGALALCIGVLTLIVVVVVMVTAALPRPRGMDPLPAVAWEFTK